MQLFAPDLLEPLLGLSVPSCAAGLVLGLALWLTGWWGHRFWIVLFTTVAAGIVGLATGKAAGLQPIVAGLLLAIAAGMMALALARVGAFIAGGFALLMVLRATLPNWEEPLLIFLVGGLAGLFLFRHWTMALTAFIGSLMMGYSGLCLANGLGKLDALAFIDHRGAIANWLCIGVAVFGVIAQLMIEKWRKQFKKQKEEQAHLQRAELELESRYRQRKSWWPFGKKSSRKAA